LGKTFFFQHHLSPAGYTHVNQDTLKVRSKCVKAVEESLLAGKSCVVGKSRKAHSLLDCDGASSTDNTNPSTEVRKLYIDLARKYGVPVRYISFAS
jgi:bifunctional polynucleotide phosphatase/kinase